MDSLKRSPVILQINDSQINDDIDLIQKVKGGFCPTKKQVIEFIKDEVEKINNIDDF